MGASFNVNIWIQWGIKPGTPCPTTPSTLSTEPSLHPIPRTPGPTPSTLSTEPYLHPIPQTPGPTPSTLSTEPSLHPIPRTPGPIPSTLSTEPSLHSAHGIQNGIEYQSMYILFSGYGENLDQEWCRAHSMGIELQSRQWGSWRSLKV